MSPSVRQTSYRLLCEALRAVLIEAVESGADAVGSIQHRAVAALYGVLMNHPVDRRGRCGSCRRPGAMVGRRRRRCRVHSEADYWLHHPDEDFLLTHLTREFGLDARPHAGIGPTEASSPRSPAVSSPPFLPGGFPRVGRPDPGPPPAQRGSLLLAGGTAWTKVAPVHRRPSR